MRVEKYKIKMMDIDGIIKWIGGRMSTPVIMLELCLKALMFPMTENDSRRFEGYFLAE